MRSIARRRLRVMLSVGALRPTTNPYIVELVRSLADEVEVSTLSWRAAVLGRFDIFHMQWPELVLRGPNRRKTWLRQAAFVGLLVQLIVRKKALVRTVHNLAPHEPGGRVESWLLRLSDRVTTVWIGLESEPPRPAGAPAVVIPHGHYVDWFRELPTPPSERGRILFFGMIRPYKGVEDLIDAFLDVDDHELTLRIAGDPRGSNLAPVITRAFGADPRISGELRHLDDAELATEIGRAELVVLPFRRMLNSGSLLLALSLGRPVLAPDRPTVAHLAHEVSPGWVLRYKDKLTAHELTSALAAVRAADKRPLPDLSARTWSRVGAAHLAAYREAVLLRSRRSWFWGTLGDT